MRRVLRIGGMIVIEDGDLATATSVPATALDAFASSSLPWAAAWRYYSITSNLITW
jgi:hypothetical protein